MNINFTYQPSEPFIEIRPDAEARNSFARVTEKMRVFIGAPEVQQVAVQTSPTLLSEWQIGLDALDKLAYVPSKTLHLTPYEIHVALYLLSAVCVTFLAVDNDLGDLPQVLVLLASIAPCRLRRRSLPPVDRVWTDGPPPPTLLGAYESLRDQTQGEEAFIVMTTAHALRSELMKLKRRNAALKSLIIDLGVVSQAFHYTIRRLAETDLKRSAKNKE